MKFLDFLFETVVDPFEELPDTSGPAWREVGVPTLNTMPDLELKNLQKYLEKRLNELYPTVASKLDHLKRLYNAMAAAAGGGKDFYTMSDKRSALESGRFAPVPWMVAHSYQDQRQYLMPTQHRFVEIQDEKGLLKKSVIARHHVYVKLAKQLAATEYTNLIKISHLVSQEKNRRTQAKKAKTRAANKAARGTIPNLRKYP